jgi:glycosyltransferase involved in cell wall biosynthesis
MLMLTLGNDMRILALDRSGLYFGSAYNLIQWAEYYINNGHSVDLLLGEDGDFREKAESVGVSVNVDGIPDVINNYGKENLKLLKIPVIFFAWFKYNIHLCMNRKLRGYDLYVANNYRTYVYFFLFFLFARVFGYKTILRYQTSDTPINFFKSISKWVFSSIIIHGTKGYAKEHFGEGFISLANVYPLPNPVDTEKFKVLPSEGKLRESLNVSSGTTIFISVSYIEPRKGVLELVKVFTKLKDKGVCLVHVGDAGSHQDYEEMVKKSAGENVFFLGRRSDIPQLLNECDAFVLYSKYEGMPYVIVEAMACGLPVVASDAGSNREVLDGVGKVVSCTDEAGLINAVLTVASGNFTVNSEHIVNRVQTKYSTKSYFQKLQEIYES